jgi:hypothetical protein
LRVGADDQRDRAEDLDAGRGDRPHLGVRETLGRKGAGEF